MRPSEKERILKELSRKGLGKDLERLKRDIEERTGRAEKRLKNICPA